MSEKYKQESYLKVTKVSILTMGELKEFVINNIKLSDEDLIKAAKQFIPIGADDKYIIQTIKTFKRKYKIDKILNDKMTFKEFVRCEKMTDSLQTFDLVPESSHDSYIQYSSYIEESYTETINYANYVAENLYVDKSYIDEVIYNDYMRYDSRKKIYDKRKRIINKLLGE